MGISFEDRFWAKVQKGPNCWLWTGWKAKGYGWIRRQYQHCAAHRIAYELASGPIPDGMTVCHTCNRPDCVNPDHLFLATQAEVGRRVMAGERNVQPTARVGHDSPASEIIPGMKSWRIRMFWRTYRKVGECWEWSGKLNTSGYGRLTVGGTLYYAHRIAYMLAHGPIPDALGLASQGSPSPVVCHRCDNRRCIRPDHLFLGTVQDNNEDMYQKGRNRRPDRKTHCKHGHELTPQNTYMHPRGYQVCQRCKRIRAVEKYYRDRQRTTGQPIPDWVTAQRLKRQGAQMFPEVEEVLCVE